MRIHPRRYSVALPKLPKQLTRVSVDISVVLVVLHRQPTPLS